MSVASCGLTGSVDMNTLKSYMYYFLVVLAVSAVLSPFAFLLISTWEKEMTMNAEQNKTWAKEYQYEVCCKP